MIKFEKVSKYKNTDLKLPTRATENSAGYDMYVAEDTVVLPYRYHNARIIDHCQGQNLHNLKNISLSDYNNCLISYPFSLDEVSTITSGLMAKPTLVSTGVKCELLPQTYLELSVRSSTPLKYWLMLANGVGVIDADYYNNPNNEGEIFFQVINLFPYAIRLKKGDKIGQGIIKPYLMTDDDNAKGIRDGGFGSTSK